MELKEITNEEYDVYAKKHEHAYYLNSSKILEGKRQLGWKVVYLGMFDKNDIKAAIGMYYVPVMRVFKYAYALRGFLIDYRDQKLLGTFTSLIKEYLKKDKISYLRIDPYIVYRVLDEDGNIKDDGNDEIVNNLITLGYHHQGFIKGLKADTQVRYMMRLDLEDKTSDDLFNNMHKMNQRNINKALKNGVEVERVGIDNLDEFMRLMEMTSEKNHLESISRQGYVNQLKAFKDDAYALVSKLDLNKYISELDNEKADLSKELVNLEKQKEELSTKKYNKRHKQLETDLQVIDDKINQGNATRMTHGDVVYLSAGFFIDYGSEILYIAGGSDESLSKYGGPFLVQWDMMRLALKENKKYYNFTGTSGDFSETSSDYGVYMFKKRFGGYPIELIGEFNLPVKKWQYNIIKLLKHLK